MNDYDAENMERELYFVNLPDKWQKRFRFFRNYGTNPSAPEYRAALKPLPFTQKLAINVNFFAVFFGVFYFFIIGLWRKGLSLFGLMFVVCVCLLLVGLPPSGANNIITVLGIFLYGSTANRAYYLHLVKKSKSWNPFEK